MTNFCAIASGIFVLIVKRVQAQEESSRKLINKNELNQVRIKPGHRFRHRILTSNMTKDSLSGPNEL